MYDFASVGNITGSFPSVASKNCSGSGTTDGTPALANWVNNFWGWMQTMLTRANGLTPSGVVEAYAADNAFSHSSPGQATITVASMQMLQALQMHFGSPGELVLWCRSQAPATVGARVLLLQGQTIAVASYPALCNAVYCGDAVNNTAGVPFYLSSDSGGVTRSTTGAYLTLPDARGVTLRGCDISNLRDPLGSTRGGGTPNGSIELDAFQGHYHSATGVATPSFSGVLGTTGLASGGGSIAASGSGIGFAGGLSIAVTVSVGFPSNDGSHGTPRYDIETRMVNLATYLGIRY